MIKFFEGDCLNIMSKHIKDKSIDAIITDQPYGTTACKWDSVIPFDLMWEQLNRIIKPNGAIVLFGSEPFSSALRMSNVKNYKYDWVWKKNRPTNFFNAYKMPLKLHENILVFYARQPTYNSIKENRSASSRNRLKYKHVVKGDNSTGVYGSSQRLYESRDKEKRLATSVQEIPMSHVENGLHPTQKPVALMEYLIKTYTNEGETVLDFTMGSGSTLIACHNTKRNGIGIEKDKYYFNISVTRYKNHIKQLQLF